MYLRSTNREEPKCKPVNKKSQSRTSAFTTRGNSLRALRMMQPGAGNNRAAAGANPPGAALEECKQTATATIAKFQAFLGIQPGRPCPTCKNFCADLLTKVIFEEPQECVFVGDADYRILKSGWLVRLAQGEETWLV